MNPKVIRLDDNLRLMDGAVVCAHCESQTGTETDWLASALIAERPAEREPGLHMPTPSSTFVNAATTFRQAVCPGCLTALLSEVVAVADRGSRSKRLEP